MCNNYNCDDVIEHIILLTIVQCLKLLYTSMQKWVINRVLICVLKYNTNYLYFFGVQLN